MTETVFTNSHAVKLFYKGQIRRFSFGGDSLQQLCDEIQNLVTPSGEFVVKYEDDEGDFVTVENDSELAYAFELVGSRPLRLKIVIKANNLESMDEGVVSAPISLGHMASKEKPWKEIKKEAKMGKFQFKQARHQWKQEMKAAKQGMKEEKSRYGVRFVKHVTADDGFEFAPSTPFVKTWRLEMKELLPGQRIQFSFTLARNATNWELLLTLCFSRGQCFLKKKLMCPYLWFLLLMVELTLDSGNWLIPPAESLDQELEFK